MLINKITSTFGDHSNLLPLFTKDVVNSTGMTAFSYDAGGKIEAKDRFIDEFGTQAIWMGGLPFFKWAIDNSVYKFAKIDPGVDVRLLKDKEQLSVAMEYAKNIKDKKHILESLENAAVQTSKAKGLFLGKFAAATALTLASFFTLVKVKQHLTRKEIERQFWEKKSQQQFYNDNLAKSPAFKAFSLENNDLKAEKVQVSKHPSFKGIASTLSATMFDPVKNLFVVDIGISGERLANSRTKTEFAETAIKEGSLLFFLYVAGSYIQNGIEKISEYFGKPIGLHAEVIASERLKNAINTKNTTKDGNVVSKLDESIKKFNEIYENNKQFIKDKNGKLTDKFIMKSGFYDYVYNTSDDIVLDMAKKSGVLKNIIEGSAWQKFIGKGKNTRLLDPHQYINHKDLKNFADNLDKLSKAVANKNVEKFLKQCRNLKIASVAANMGISCLFLGLIVPYSMMKYRESHQNGKKEFHVQSEIEKQLEKSFKGRIA